MKSPPAASGHPPSKLRHPSSLDSRRPRRLPPLGPAAACLGAGSRRRSGPRTHPRAPAHQSALDHHLAHQLRFGRPESRTTTRSSDPHGGRDRREGPRSPTRPVPEPGQGAATAVAALAPGFGRPRPLDLDRRQTPCPPFDFGRRDCRSGRGRRAVRPAVRGNRARSGVLNSLVLAGSSHGSTTRGGVRVASIPKRCGNPVHDMCAGCESTVGNRFFSAGTKGIVPSNRAGVDGSSHLPSLDRCQRPAARSLSLGCAQNHRIRSRQTHVRSTIRTRHQRPPICRRGDPGRSRPVARLSRRRPRRPDCADAVLRRNSRAGGRAAGRLVGAGLFRPGGLPDGPSVRAGGAPRSTPRGCSGRARPRRAGGLSASGARIHLHHRRRSIHVSPASETRTSKRLSSG